jgi:hypothetical protein
MSFHLCVDERCRTTRRNASRLDWIYIDDPSIKDEGPVDVRLLIQANPDGRVVVDAKTQVSLTKIQPNGPGCEPTKFATTLVATQDGFTE